MVMNLEVHVVGAGERGSTFGLREAGKLRKPPQQQSALSSAQHAVLFATSTAATRTAYVHDAMVALTQPMDVK